MGELTLGALREQAFHRVEFPVSLLHQKGTISLAPEGVTISPGDQRFSWESLVGWEYQESHFYLSYQLNDAVHSVVLRFRESVLEDFRQAFHLYRLRRYAKALPASQDRQLIPCSACGLHVSLPSGQQPASFFCPECLAICHGDEVLTEARGEPYNFCEDGLFRMVGKESRHQLLHFAQSGAYAFRSFQAEVVPTLDKIIGHALWAVLWLAVLMVVWYPVHWGWLGHHFTVISFVLYVPMVLISLHLTMLGFYASGLVMSKSLRTLLRPHPYEKLASLCASGQLNEAERYLHEHHLENHPGMVSNLGGNHLQEAYTLCPNHPALIQLNLRQGKDTETWRTRLQEVVFHNQLTVGEGAYFPATPANSPDRG